MVELLEYGFTFHIYESYLSSFNDWQSRLIVARFLTLIAPFRAMQYFLVFSPYVCQCSCSPLGMAVNFGLCVSHKVDEHQLSSFSINRKCFKQTFVPGGNYPRPLPKRLLVASNVHSSNPFFLSSFQGASNRHDPQSKDEVSPTKLRTRI